jgi:hypothetical protein
MRYQWFKGAWMIGKGGKMGWIAICRECLDKNFFGVMLILGVLHLFLGYREVQINNEDD